MARPEAESKTTKAQDKEDIPSKCARMRKGLPLTEQEKDIEAAVKFIDNPSDEQHAEGHDEYSNGDAGINDKEESESKYEEDTASQSSEVSEPPATLSGLMLDAIYLVAEAFEPISPEQLRKEIEEAGGNALKEWIALDVIKAMRHVAHGRRVINAGGGNIACDLTHTRVEGNKARSQTPRAVGSWHSNSWRQEVAPASQARQHSEEA